MHGVGHDTTATSISGVLEVDQVGGRLTATTASGDVRVHHLTGDVEIGTTSGDVRIDHFDGAEASIRSVSGDVELGLPLGHPGPARPGDGERTDTAAEPAAPSSGTPTEPRRTVRLRIKTVSGNITLGRVR